MRVAFTIPGLIGGKGRARISTRGGQVRSYTPEKTRVQESIVRTVGAEAMAGRPPMEGPIELEIVVWQIPPKSWSARKRMNALYVTGRPDADNVGKLVADSLNSICYGDDAQISDLVVRRRYTITGTARVIIAVQSLVSQKLEQRRILGMEAA